VGATLSVDRRALCQRVRDLSARRHVRSACDILSLVTDCHGVYAVNRLHAMVFAVLPHIQAPGGLVGSGVVGHVTFLGTPSTYTFQEMEFPTLEYI